MEMIMHNDGQDYQVKNGMISVESVYSSDKTITDLIKEYLLQRKNTATLITQ